MLLLLLLSTGLVRATITPDSLWVAVQSRLDTDTTGTVDERLPGYITSKYPGDVAAALRALEFVRYRVEAERYDLLLAASLAEASAELAGQTGHRVQEARAHHDLSRYYYALKFNRRGAEALDRAIALYAELDDTVAYDYARISAFMRIGQAGDPERAIAGLQTIAAAATYPGGARVRSKAYRRLLFYSIRGEETAQLRYYVQQLDSLKVQLDSVHRQVAEGAIAYGKAYLARFEGRYPAALSHYETAAAIAAAEPDHWRTANAHLQQAHVARAMGAPARVHAYLDRAQRIAGSRTINDLLIDIYRLRAELAVASGDFRAALDYRDKQTTYQQLLDERTGDFNHEAYYLRKEKRQLEQIRTAQAARLEGQRQRLLLLRITIALGLGLLALSAFGLYYQRRARRKLARQYAITEQQAAELQLQEQARTRFFTNVSHELRTPLTLVLDPVRTLALSGDIKPNARQLLDTATRNGAELEDLIGQILDFDRLENGRIQPRPVPVALAAYLDRLLAAFRPLAARKAITYEYRIDPSLQLVAAIDRTLYRRMLNNLVANALKFTPRGGEVSAVLSERDGRIHIHVSDTGPGIAATDRRRVFERFYQSESGRLSGKGSGIGLSMVKAYAELLGGSVILDSTWQQGARFVLDLPLDRVSDTPHEAAESEGRAPVLPVSALAPPPSDRPRILVVEDHVDLQDYLRLLLEDQFIVDTANHGQEALALLAADSSYSLVLTDLMMPVMDGFALLTALKAHPELRHLPVVVLSARTGPDDRLRALRIGVDDYLTKPFRTDQLFAVLTALLANRSGRGKAVDDAAPSSGPTELPTEDQRWLTDFETYVEEHLTDHDFSVAALAKSFAMSESTLLRTLRRLTGLTPARYVQEVRLARARRLLETGTLPSVKAAADAVGYADSRSFSRAYRKRFGHLPSELLAAG